jgi:hypothetical protein
MNSLPWYPVRRNRLQARPRALDAAAAVTREQPRRTLEVIRMLHYRAWAAVVESRLAAIVLLLSLLVAACNNGGKGPGY